jgi:Anti-sigma-K factor rskA
MSLDHTRIEELMAIDALDGLDGDDRHLLATERASHGDCEECRALEAGFAETAGRLAFALTPLPVDDAVADAILSSPPSADDELTDELAERRRRRRPAWQAIAAVAAAVAIAVVAGTTLVPSSTDVTVAASSQRFVDFSPAGETEGSLAMAFTPGEPGIIVWGRDVPDVDEGSTYELWTFEGDTPVSAGCMTPTDGRMGVALPDVEATDVMAVTVESADCPDAPEGEVAFSLELA